MGAVLPACHTTVLSYLHYCVLSFSNNLNEIDGNAGFAQDSLMEEV